MSFIYHLYNLPTCQIVLPVSIRIAIHTIRPAFEKLDCLDFEGMDKRFTKYPGIKGITVLNSPGTIDAAYRGEINVILVNLSAEEFVIEDGERIAQMVIARHEQAEWEEVEVLDETERG